MNQTQTDQPRAKQHNHDKKNRGGASESFLDRGRGYVQDSVGELKKVSFPTRQETVQATIVTIVIMLFVSVALFVMDVVFRNLMAALVA